MSHPGVSGRDERGRTSSHLSERWATSPSFGPVGMTACLPSFRHASRHSGMPPVIPACLPSFRHASRHSGMPPGVVFRVGVKAPVPSFRRPYRRSSMPPSFRRKPESTSPPRCRMPASWRKGTLYGGMCLWREWASATLRVARGPELNLLSLRVGVTWIPAVAGKAVGMG